MQGKFAGRKQLAHRIGNPDPRHRLALSGKTFFRLAGDQEILHVHFQEIRPGALDDRQIFRAGADADEGDIHGGD